MLCCMVQRKDAEGAPSSQTLIELVRRDTHGPARHQASKWDGQSSRKARGPQVHAALLVHMGTGGGRRLSATAEECPRQLQSDISVHACQLPRNYQLHSLG